MPVAGPAPAAPVRGLADDAGHDTHSLASVERDHIQRALAKAGGNKKVAAQMLGLSRRALYRRLERLDLVDTISRRRESRRPDQRLDRTRARGAHVRSRTTRAAQASLLAECLGRAPLAGWRPACTSRTHHARHARHAVGIPGE